MPDRSTIEFRLLLTLGVIALVAIAGILAILPYRLYERDIRHASEEAHRVSAVVEAALACPLGAATTPAELVDRIQGAGRMQLALARVEAGEIPAGAVAGRGSSVLDDTDLRYVSSAVTDSEGRSWVAEMHFDLTAMKRESVRLILDLVIAVTLGAGVFSVAIYVLFRRALVRPLRDLARWVEAAARGDAGQPPAFESREMNELLSSIERLAGDGARRDRPA